MNKNEKGFYLFFDWLERLKELPPEEAIKVVYAICDYYRNDTNPTEHFHGTLKIVVALMFDQIKRGEKLSEVRAEAGQKGGFAKAKKSKTQICHDLPRQNVATYNNITNNNITNIKEESIKEEKRKRFLPPSLDEVKNYCLERGNNVDAQRFVDYYTANGWVQAKGKPIKDWKAAVRTWENNEAAKQDKLAATKTTSEYNPKERHGSFDVDDAFEKALKRSYGKGIT